MQVIVKKVPISPEYDWRDDDRNKDGDDLGSYYLDILDEHGVHRAYYWYQSGSYDGSGYILMMRNNTWQWHSMGHCSCYGPFENIDWKTDAWTDIQSLVPGLERIKQWNILEAIKQDGYISSYECPEKTCEVCGQLLPKEDEDGND